MSDSVKIGILNDDISGINSLKRFGLKNIAIELNKSLLLNVNKGINAVVFKNIEDPGIWGSFFHDNLNINIDIKQNFDIQLYTLIHEFGHAFHSLKNPIDFSQNWNKRHISERLANIYGYKLLLRVKRLKYAYRAWYVNYINKRFKNEYYKEFKEYKNKSIICCYSYNEWGNWV